MKSLLYLMSLLTIVSTAAGAQGRREGRMAGGPQGMHHMMMPNLSDEQRTKFEESRVRFLKETEPMRADLQKQESALRLEQTADKLNDAKVKSTLSEIARLQTDLAAKRIAHQRTIRELLTPEQRTQFDARLLQGGPGPGRGMMKGRGMGRQRGPGAMMGPRFGRDVNNQ